MQIHLSLFLFICVVSSGWSDLIFLAQNPSHHFLIFEGAAGATCSGKPHHWDCVASSSKFLYSWSDGSYGAVCILMSASLHCLNFWLDHLEERVHHSPFLLSLYWSICALDPTSSVCSKSCLLQLSFSLCHHWFLLNRIPTISIPVCYCISPVKTNKTNKQTKHKASFESSLPPGPSLVAQGLRIRLALQRTLVQSLIQEDSTCGKATKSVYHNYWSLCV